MKRKRLLLALALAVLSLVLSLGLLLVQTADEARVNHWPPVAAARTGSAHGDTYGAQQQFFYATATAEALRLDALNAPQVTP